MYLIVRQSSKQQAPTSREISGSITQMGARQRVVIPSEVEESGGETIRLFRGVLRLRFARLRMTPQKSRETSTIFDLDTPQRYFSA
jgi:hypothetical protein